MSLYNELEIATLSAFVGQIKYLFNVYQNGDTFNLDIYNVKHVYFTVNANIKLLFIRSIVNELKTDISFFLRLNLNVYDDI